MAFTKQNKVNGHGNWVKISQAHIDAKNEILKASLKEECFGWHWKPAVMEIAQIVEHLFHERAAAHSYTTYYNGQGEHVIDITLARSVKQQLTGQKLTREVLVSWLAERPVGVRSQIRLKYCNSDIRKGRSVIPDTTFMIVNLHMLETGLMKSTSHFDARTFRRLAFKELEGLAIRLVKDKNSALADIIPPKADTHAFITDVFKIWNRI